MIRSLTLIERRGDATTVFTMRPDGHTSGGTKEGPDSRNVTRDLAPEAVAKVFELAKLPLDIPTGQGGDAGQFTLTINGPRRRQFVWPIDERPADPRLLALVEAIESLRSAD